MMIQSCKLKQFFGRKKAVVMLNAMAYHSTIKKDVRMKRIPRKDIGKGTEALVPITFFDIEGAIEYYNERLNHDRYNHLRKTTLRYIADLTRFKESL